MTKAVQKTNGALALAECTLEGGQVLNVETVKNYLVRGNGPRNIDVYRVMQSSTS